MGIVKQLYQLQIAFFVVLQHQNLCLYIYVNIQIQLQANLLINILKSFYLQMNFQDLYDQKQPKLFP